MIIDADGHTRRHRAGNNSLLFELLEAQREHTVTQAGYRRRHIAEAGGATEQRSHNRTGPAPAEHFDSMMVERTKRFLRGIRLHDEPLSKWAFAHIPRRIALHKAYQVLTKLMIV